MSATTEIREKWQKLKAIGIDLGAEESAEQDAGYGGRIQVYRNGRIYWHHTIGCFEVHGGILNKYLSAGGHDANPLSGKRELGFPISDESRTADGYKPVSYFEWGAIYWCYGGVSIHGDIFKKYQALGEVTGDLRYPISSIIKTGGLTIGYFESGCICLAPFLDGPLVIDYNFPLMGNALLVSPEDTDPFDKKLYFKALLTTTQKNAIEQSGIDIIKVVAGSFFQLQAVAGAGATSPLYPLSATGNFNPVSSLPFTGGVYSFNLKGFLSLQAGVSLADRTLYNICFVSGNNIQVITPHCIYTKKDTTNFGLMHATDFHVSRRLDGIRSRLYKKGLTEGVSEFVNWNDKFRDLVKNANYLHDIGDLDIILATGDLVDFVFEKDDNRKGGGNFALFRDIVLGKSTYGDDEIYPPNKNLLHEELRVPIYTTLGNHDYRANPYEFFADLDAGDLGPIDFWPWSDRDISSYSGLNITESEVKALQDGKKLSLNMYDAANSLKADPHAQFYYNKYISSSSNYVVKLGINTVLVIDSKWDLGILDVSAKDILKVIFGATSENENNLMDVNPDSIGFSEEEINLVRSTLASASTDGVMILGVHSPIINAKGNEYPHYFRQTEHPTIEKELINGYLIRQNSYDYSIKGGVANRDKPYSDWIRTGTPNFKNQDPNNMLDYGTSRGEIIELMKLCLGQGVARPIDAILCGHGHRRVEYRFAWNGEENFLFYTDFYTENPSQYYSSVYNEKYQNTPQLGISPQIISVKEKKNVRIFIAEGASLSERPLIVTDNRTGIYWKESTQLRVPPYNNPLNKTSDCKTWWKQHRPIMMQTAAVGSGTNQRKDPSVNKEMPEPNFSGVRLLSVENNVIAKVRYLLMDDIRKKNFKLSR